MAVFYRFLELELVKLKRVRIDVMKLFNLFRMKRELINEPLLLGVRRAWLLPS